MSKITNDGLTRSGTGCFLAVPMWQQWASKGFNSQPVFSGLLKVNQPWFLDAVKLSGNKNEIATKRHRMSTICLTALTRYQHARQTLRALERAPFDSMNSWRPPVRNKEGVHYFPIRRPNCAANQVGPARVPVDYFWIPNSQVYQIRPPADNVYSKDSFAYLLTYSW